MALPSRRNYIQRRSYKGRERSGLDTQYFAETFQGTVINTSQWAQNTSTMTIAQSNGITLNNGSSVASGAYAILTSYPGVGISGEFPIQTSFVFSLSQVPQANNVIELGVGFVATTAAPTDGVFLRINANGKNANGVVCPLQLVCNVNGSETVYFVEPNTNTTQPASPDAGGFDLVASTRYKVELVMADDVLEVFINNITVGSLDAKTGLALLTNAQSWPLQIRNYNSGVVANAQQLTVYQAVSLNGDSDDVKPWPHTAACAGWAAYQGRTGSGTVGQTTQWTNSTQPSSAALSNTTAGYTTFGGKFQFAAVAGAETDYVLFGFQNPVGTATVPGSQLHITDIRISTTNTGASVATTGTVLEWAIAVGSTAVSLATAQSANTKAPCKVPLGVQGFRVGDLIGYTPIDIYEDLITPIVANPGEFVQIIVRVPVGTATASEVFRGVVMLNGYND